MTLAVTFAAWMLMLLGGFGLLLHVAGAQFHPHLATRGDAFWVAGSSLLTLGVSEFDASGIARWLILACGLSGFSALTASVTFMLQIQSSLHQREPAVMALVGLAGTPPSGVRILEGFAALGDRAELRAFFIQWRDWSASTLHSHLSFPILSYYRSLDAQHDWLAALEAVLDAATLVAVATEEDSRGAATLMHRSGARLATQLASMFGMDPATPECPPAEVAEAIARVAAAGYAIGPGGTGSGAVRRFLAMRADYAGDLEALAAHLGANRAALVPPDEARHGGSDAGRGGA